MNNPGSPEQFYNETEAESQGEDLKVLTERCHNFLRQSTPFSETGKVMKSRVEDALASGSDDLVAEVARELPTVENMRLDLFEPPQLNEREKEAVFRHESLSCIQITQGCTHDCEMCTQTSKHLTQMPLVMIGKISEEVEKSSDPVEKVWDDWVLHIKGITGVDLDEMGHEWIKEQVENGFSDDAIKLIRTIEKEFPRHEIFKYFDYPEGEITPIALDDPDRRRTVKHLFKLYPSSPSSLRRDLNVFYDSDPFDWRDTSLRHADGQIADFGDAFHVLATPLRPLYISTAGWQEGDRLGPIAAKKIVDLCNENNGLIAALRLSISPTEGLARKDLNRYREHLKTVVSAFKGLPINIVFRLDQDGSPEHRAFEEQVRAPLIEFINREKTAVGEDPRLQDFYYQVQTGSISHWYERDNNPDYEKERDPGACMGGVHIWPDGSVALQKGSLRSYPENGSRPQKTSLKLYQPQAMAA